MNHTEFIIICRNGFTVERYNYDFFNDITLKRKKMINGMAIKDTKFQWLATKRLCHNYFRK